MGFLNLSFRGGLVWGFFANVSFNPFMAFLKWSIDGTIFFFLFLFCFWVMLTCDLGSIWHRSCTSFGPRLFKPQSLWPSMDAPTIKSSWRKTRYMLWIRPPLRSAKSCQNSYFTHVLAGQSLCSCDLFISSGRAYLVNLDGLCILLVRICDVSWKLHKYWMWTLAFHICVNVLWNWVNSNACNVLVIFCEDSMPRELLHVTYLVLLIYIIWSE